jgi:hypothetical protein
MKRTTLIIALAVFILTCLFPPWQSTGNRYRGHEPAGYSLIFIPPSEYYGGIQIDFGRLFIEWAALAAITGIVWVIVIKPSWLGKANDSQKFTPPPGNPEN